MNLRADSLASTHAIAAALAGLARSGDVVVLAGDMGAGKTAFAQGFGRALGITEAITSPTFTLVHSYPVPGSKLTLHHADLYRLDSTSDVDDLALDELAEFDGIVLIEWGDVAASTLGDYLEVRLAPETDDDGDDESDGERARADDEHDPVDDDDRGDGSSDDDAARGEDVFELDTPRLIELNAAGGSWASRWYRVESALGSYRC